MGFFIMRGFMRTMRTMKNQKGITATEVIIVMAIVTILSGIGLGTYASNLSRYRFNAAARDLVSDMRLARSEAAKDNWQYALRIDTAKSYEVIRGDQPWLQSSVSFTSLVSQDNWQAEGRSDISWSVPTLMPVFQPDGTITSWNSTTGTISSLPPEPLILQNGQGDIKTINMSRFGRIKLQ